MNCPKCDALNTRILETERVRSGLKRYRICQACSHKFTTLESAVVWDRTLSAYQRVEPPAPTPAPVPPSPPKLALVRRPAAAGSRFVAQPGHPALLAAALPPEIEELVLVWWNESRWSKHRGKATWTERAFVASIERLARVIQPARQLELIHAAVEAGWQALKVDYLGGFGPRPVASPPTGGGPRPRDPHMNAALESWAG